MQVWVHALTEVIQSLTKLRIFYFTKFCGIVGVAYTGELGLASVTYTREFCENEIFVESVIKATPVNQDSTV
jgi:hypothetical protein